MPRAMNAGVFSAGFVDIRAIRMSLETAGPNATDELIETTLAAPLVRSFSPNRTPFQSSRVQGLFPGGQSFRMRDLGPVSPS
jgi:hypothetical protein